MSSYKVIHTTPNVETYISLRALSGLSPKTTRAAEIGLSNTLFAIQVAVSEAADRVIGMGRIIGDGGCFFHLVDMAVVPEHQGKGVGKLIMKELKEWMDKNVPPTGVVILIADGPAKHLYKQYGFVETSGLSTSSIGMACMY